MALSALEYGEEDRKRLEKPASGSSSGDIRSDFQHDRDRIIHSLAFRRLQGKTQVYGLGASDYYRSRLTHSLEVAQIGRALALKLGADPDLTEAICLAHDIGHPPFGHAGESVLHRTLKDYGGFNGNAQNLRIVAVLERKNAVYKGLNLTSATLDGLIKYPYIINPHLDAKRIESRKGYYGQDEPIVKSFKSHNSKTFECQIMNWADDVAYSSHDLEDALVIGTIRRDDLQQNERKERIAEHAIASYSDEHSEFAASHPMTESDVSDWVDHITKHCVDASLSSGSRIGTIKQYVSRHIHECVSGTSAVDVDATPARYSRKVILSPEITKKVEIFKAVVFVSVIRTSPVYTLQHAGMRILDELFAALTDVRDKNLIYLFPVDDRSDAQDALRAHLDGETRGRMHTFVRDFLASMTDANCEAMWRRMFSPGGSLFMSRA